MKGSGGCGVEPTRNAAEGGAHTTTDLDLLDRWARGDREAGEALFTRHVDAVRRFFANKVVESSDLVQATFLSCMEEPKRFSGRSSFRTYLLSIAKFKLYHHYRVRGLQRERATLPHNTSSIFDRGPSPSTLLMREDRDRNLLMALRRIPLQHQMILELAYWEELSGSELAEVLDIPLTTVYTRLHRAKQLLRKVLDDIDGER